MPTIYGTNGDDTLTGQGDSEHFVGLGGDDLIFGKGGADTLQGAVGADHLFGGHGDDNLFGDKGRDLERGGAGADGLSGQEGADTLRGGPGADSLGGGEGADDERFRDQFFGGQGDDTFFVGLRDIVDGGSGFDLFFLTLPDADADGARADFTGLLEDGAHVHGTTLRDLERGIIFATALADRLVLGSGGLNVEAGAGNDRLTTAGFNTLYAREGDDTLVATAPGGRFYGGEGADTFVFTSLKAAFNQFIFDLDENDIVDLHRIDADVNTRGNQDFVLADSPTGVAGEIYLTFDGNYTIVNLDVGDGELNHYLAIVGDHRDFSNFDL